MRCMCYLGTILLQHSLLVSGYYINHAAREASNQLSELPHLVPRDLLKCEPPRQPRLLLERSLEGYDAYNGTDVLSDLQRRVMVQPDGNDKASMNRFMRREIAESMAIVWPNQANNPQNTGLIELFGADAISAGMNHLCGCTGLVIISKTGYFAGHYWESISFDPDAIWGFKSRDIALQRSVLDIMENGKGNAIPHHPSLKRKGGTFNDDSVRAFLIKPHISTDQAPGAYRPAWDKMKAKVGQLVPSLDPVSHADRWQEVTYTKIDREDTRLDTTAAGNVLIKYDPDDPEDSKRKRVSLWVEWTKIYDFSW